MLRLLICLLPLLFGLGSTSSAAADSRIFTLWPLIDYRSEAEQRFRSLHLLGPVIKRQEYGEEQTTALRPLIYQQRDSSAGSSRTQVLYPLFSLQTDRDSLRFNCLHLLYGNFDRSGSPAGREFYLFPFLFYEQDREQGTTAALFPFGGTLRNWFRRDRISFTLFPLYSRTERDGRRIDNVLWPFFARVSGENESGFKIWPLYGASSKEDVYRKRFFLWPIFFAEDLDLDTPTPTRRRAAWPLYLQVETAKSRYTSVLWPFFSRQQGFEDPYVQWNLPWPLVRVTSGEQRHGFRFLPFYADETIKSTRTSWAFWPVFKREETHTEKFQRQRHRVLFFLFSDIHEEYFETGEIKKRVDFWPLFSYSKEDGLRHFHLFSLLEPMFPGNRGIEENWAPLWRVYQQKWDDDGNRIVSLFWNLFWQDHRSNGNLAWELFPFVAFRRQAATGIDLQLFKGLMSFHREPSGERFLKLFYLPWELSLGSTRGDETGI